MTVRLRPGNGRPFALRLPLFLLWLLLLPFAAVLAPVALGWCMAKRINPIQAAGAVWALLGASRGTAVDVEHPDAGIQVRIV
jgi:hypothetical protein